MNAELSESSIVRTVARQAAERVARRTVVSLQKMRPSSLDVEELGSVWNEICVQVQDEESFFRDACDQVVRALVESHARRLSEPEQQAVWLQTDPGFEWDCSDPDERGDAPFSLDDIVDHVVDEHVYAQAAQWSNTRIRKFIERSAMRD